MYTAWRIAEASRETSLTKAKLNLENAKNQQTLHRQNVAHKHLFKRLHFDGLEDLHKAGSRRQKTFWILFIVACYSTGTFMWIRKLDEYRIGKTAIFVETELPKAYRHFPRVTICHMSGWNKTFMESNVEINDAIVAAASRIGLDKLDLITEFSRYLDYYTTIDTDLDTSEKPLREMLTQIFDLNFRETQVVDFITDAAFRRKQLFRECSFSGDKYPCNPGLLSIASPSCYVVPIFAKREYNETFYFGLSINAEWGKIQIINPKLEVSLKLPNRHVFTDRIGAGLKIFLGDRSFTPFSNEILQTPGNTHAIIVYRPVLQTFLTDCYPSQVRPKLTTMSYYYEDACLADKIQNETKRICGCHMIAGDYRPLNGLVCTPNQIEQCVHEQVLASLRGTKTLRQEGVDCKPRCEAFTEYSSMTYYALEGPDDQEYVTNKVTILHDPQRQIHEGETYLTDSYVVLCDIGGLVGVYTGLSFAAGVQSAVLIALSLLFQAALMNMTLLKPIIAPYVDIPLAGTLPPRSVVAKVQGGGKHSNQQHQSVAKRMDPGVSIRMDRRIQVRRTIHVQSV